MDRPQVYVEQFVLSSYGPDDGPGSEPVPPFTLPSGAPSNWQFGWGAKLTQSARRNWERYPMMWDPQSNPRVAGGVRGIPGLHPPGTRNDPPALCLLLFSGSSSPSPGPTGRSKQRY